MKGEKKLKKSFLEMLQRNTTLRKAYLQQLEHTDMMVKMLEAAPEEHTLSNAQVAGYLRQWMEDMLHIDDFLDEEVERAEKALKEIEDLSRGIRK